MNLRSPRSMRADALVRAVLAAEWPVPLPTGTVEERIGMPCDPVVLRILNRLASLGEAEKLTFADMKSRYWRLAAPPHPLPVRREPGKTAGRQLLTIPEVCADLKITVAEWSQWRADGNTPLHVIGTDGEPRVPAHHLQRWFEALPKEGPGGARDGKR